MTRWWNIMVINKKTCLNNQYISIKLLKLTRFFISKNLYKKYKLIPITLKIIKKHLWKTWTYIYHWWEKNIIFITENNRFFFWSCNRIYLTTYTIAKYNLSFPFFFGLNLSFSQDNLYIFRQQIIYPFFVKK